MEFLIFHAATGLWFEIGLENNLNHAPTIKRIRSWDNRGGARYWPSMNLKADPGGFRDSCDQCAMRTRASASPPATRAASVTMSHQPNFTWCLWSRGVKVLR